ncbi:MAG TPA: LCP family protein [Candidatus Deferrimicrobiaceae bacterium]|nr:LCP family protein [Candidatus Deferrimicrobiaceae bacterium]
MEARRSRAAHARPLQRRRAVSPDGSATDARRTLAATASALVPGLGQLLNGRRDLARLLAAPAVVVLAAGVLLGATQSMPRLVGALLSREVVALALAANTVALAWRLTAVGHAFFDRRYPRVPGRGAAIALVALVVATAAPHLLVNAWGSAAQATLDRVFVTGAPDDRRPVAAVLGEPGMERRLNVLLVGIDKTPRRPATLTDTMIVASIDPVGRTVTLVSIPRDTIGVPLGNGDTFAPKLNSLMGYAERHPEVFPQGPMRALEDAAGALLGIQIQYYVKIDFGGFVKLVDAVGGIDVKVKRGFDDPGYSGRGIPDGQRGWSVEAGVQHFAGWEALAYARSRKALGESDFTRASRQQEIIVALRKKILDGGSVVTNLPALLDAVGDLVETDVPRDQLPALAALADELSDARIFQVVLARPLVKGTMDPDYGSVQVPHLNRILSVARGLFPEPGEPVIPWPAS